MPGNLESKRKAVSLFVSLSILQHSSHRVDRTETQSSHLRQGQRLSLGYAITSAVSENCHCVRTDSDGSREVRHNGRAAKQNETKLKAKPGKVSRDAVQSTRRGVEGLELANWLVKLVVDEEPQASEWVGIAGRGGTRDTEACHGAEARWD